MRLLRALAVKIFLLESITAMVASMGRRKSAVIHTSAIVQGVQPSKLLITSLTFAMSIFLSSMPTVSSVLLIILITFSISSLEMVFTAFSFFFHLCWGIVGRVLSFSALLIIRVICLLKIRKDNRIRTYTTETIIHCFIKFVSIR